MTVLAVYNLKGGVGKTATAVNLAYLAAQAGYRTLVWDLDPQGAASYYFRIKPKIKGDSRQLVRGKTDLDGQIRATDFDGLDLLPADESYRAFDRALGDVKKSKRRLAKLVKPLRKDYDLLVLDCPSGLSLLSENVFHAADLLLMPLIPTSLSLRSLDQVRAFMKKETPRKPPHLVPFFTMVDRRKKLHREVVAAGLDGLEVLPATIPHASAVEQMGLHRAPLPTFAPRHRATQAYRALWRAVEQQRAVYGV